MTIKELEQKIIELYAGQDVLVEHLPYTDAFDSMYEKVKTYKDDITKHQLWRVLTYLRKRSRLDLKVKKTEETIRKESGIKGFGL